MRQFALVGLGPLATGTLDEQPEPVRRGLTRAAVDARAYLQKVSEAVGSITGQNRTVNGWTYNPANWCRMAESGDFLGRAATQALSGGLENCVEEAVKLRVFTDEAGECLNGDRRYRLHFEPGQVPEVDAFWSITLYDNRFNLVANPAGKYAIPRYRPGYPLRTGRIADHCAAERPAGRSGGQLAADADGRGLQPLLPRLPAVAGVHRSDLCAAPGRTQRRLRERRAALPLTGQSPGATTRRLFTGCSVRAEKPSARSSAAICCALASTGSASTCQFTFSLQGGVVSEP